MPLPSYSQIMLPLLDFANSVDKTTLKQAAAYLIDKLNISEEDANQLNKDGRTRTFYNRVGWAQTYLKKACLIEYTGKGEFFITDRGRKLLDKNLSEITPKYLENYTEFLDFKTTKGKSEEPQKLDSVDEQLDPKELFEKSFYEIKHELATQLLDQVKQMDPFDFEKLVVDLLVKMGYGGSHSEAMASVTKRSRDGGIDGIINEDRLGLDKIYVQAKRYTDNIVGQPKIAEFAGNLQGFGGLKGVFITTSDFSRDALEYAEKLSVKIVLINGQDLVKYMIDYNIGVSERESYVIKELDLEYFAR